MKFAGLVLAGTLGALAIGSQGQAAPDAPPLKAMLWAPASADPARAFGTAPTECLKPSADPATGRLIEIGRAAFRTPLVLGGQASRAGISCENCHRSGRTNPDFLFPGVSGAPGTADVTSSLFSSHRGNGVDDPKPIPDLSGPKSALKISQAPGERALEPFIHGLITEEFDGPEPTAKVLAGLAAYVRALDPGGCPALARQPLTVAFLMGDARRAVRAAQGQIAAGDNATAVVMLAGARARLSLIDERFDTPDLAAVRDTLRAADRRLAAVQTALREHRSGAGAALSAWLVRSRALESGLAARAPGSLFDARRLAQAAKRRLPG